MGAGRNFEIFLYETLIGAKLLEAQKNRHFARGAERKLFYEIHPRTQKKIICHSKKETRQSLEISVFEGFI